jgi:hypothetical protein
MINPAELLLLSILAQFTRDERGTLVQYYIVRQ